MKRTKKIMLSLALVGAVAAAVGLGSVAFFSDTETSENNVLQAGAIDLEIDNHSYYNGYSVDGSMQFMPDNSWELGEEMKAFFSFFDLKPGDIGEDTISLHLTSNEAWVCADIALTANDDFSSTEPELEVDVPEDAGNAFDGELAQNLYFVFWIDDGDNVYEVEEVVLTEGWASDVLAEGVSWAIADSTTQTGPMQPDITYYIGKAWCLGQLSLDPLEQLDAGGPDVRGPGVTCDAAYTGNIAQTDRIEGSVSFTAVQARHNEEFECDPSDVVMRTLSLENKDESWDIIPDDLIKGDIDYSHNDATFHGVVTGQGLESDSMYQISLNGPGVCTTTDDNLATFGTTLFESGYWNNYGQVSLSSSCGADLGQGIYNMTLVGDYYTFMSDGAGNFSYPFNLSLPSGDYTGVKVLVKKMRDDHASPWVDTSVVHTTNLFETAAISFTVL